MAVVRRRVRQNQIPLALDDFICGICREIFKSPRQLPCSHIFCTECLLSCKEIGSNTGSYSCPCCRKNYSPQQERIAHDVAEKIRYGTSECNNCNKVIPLQTMQSHLDSCEQMKLDENVSKAVNKMFLSSREEDIVTSNLPVAVGFGVLGSQRQGNLKQIPGTFDCPYCNTKKLGRDSLLKHVLELHSRAPPNVVCPICAAMPWGDPNQKSQNFLQHLQLRHRYDYDRFVDMNKDEDTVFQEVLKKSMYDQGRFFRP